MPLTITIQISDADLLVLQNDIPDVEKWVRDAVDGRTYKAKGRMVRDWQKRLIADPDVETIPANADGIIQMAVARPDYRNRVQR